MVVTQLPLLGDTIQARFEEFHRANPRVYDILRDVAFDYKRHGYPRIGIAHLVEIVRWNLRMEIYDSDGTFKINNDFRSRYARLLMERESALRGFITVRELHTP